MSLTDQIYGLYRLAIKEGYPDAADWLRRTWETRTGKPVKQVEDCDDCGCQYEIELLCDQCGCCPTDCQCKRDR